MSWESASATLIGILFFNESSSLHHISLQAYDNVNEETRKLDVNTDRACDSVNAAFNEFQQMLEKRRTEVLQVHGIAEQ